MLLITIIGPWRCGCLVTWFCYQLIAKPGNKTAAPHDPTDLTSVWIKPPTNKMDLITLFEMWYMYLCRQFWRLIESWFVMMPTLPWLFAWEVVIITTSAANQKVGIMATLDFSLYFRYAESMFMTWRHHAIFLILDASNTIYWLQQKVVIYHDNFCDQVSPTAGRLCGINDPNYSKFTTIGETRNNVFNCCEGRLMLLSCA